MWSGWSCRRTASKPAVENKSRVATLAAWAAYGLAEMAEWIRDGQVKYREHVWEGLEHAPAAFAAMLQGGNFGKALVRVGDDPTTTPALESCRGAGNVLAG